ncbi:MAG: beta/gamma crystallin domain-containing protein [Methylococcaceae bacterium]
MNRIRLVPGDFKALFVALLLSGVASTAYASDEDCWAEFFESNDYAGKHLRLDGPIQLENLRNVNGENWESRIDSIKVGPKASVTVFENIDFKLTLKEIAKYPDLMRSLGVTEQDAREDSELIFGAKSKIHDLSDFNFHHKTRSLKIDCIK